MTATSTLTRKEAPKTGDSVVTPERYATGMTTFAQWMASIEKNAELFQRHYDEFTPTPHDIAALKKYADERGVKALILGTDWCPDVWRGLPVACKIAEQSGMELRIFERDANSDIMSEFLKQGEFESVPTIVLYDGDDNYLGHWIERADQANAEMAPLREIMAGKERDTPEWDTARAQYMEETWFLAEGWRQAQVHELLALVAEALD
ncbi:MAG: thioredoxin family protein [Chloroflexi bacterium]|nr:thioredoxin family protein [Chloroflexota bacterium]MDA1147896.1 thioredoxin family protein [Chloroflexota bacterium]MQC25559.1 hypothetical protein [Chloroflexota bacterium]MQC83163.1 hypothetical protein [Chloroflexota bacterium]